MRFEEFNLSEEVLAGIHEAGFTECTDVQAETLKRTLRERDVTVQSQTGTGKTAAYLTTIFQLKLSSERFKNRPALVVAPTRELAVQIEHDAEILGSQLGFRIGCFYGGAGYVDQERKLERGVDLIIGTPGRLLDFSSSHKLDLGSVGIVVIDEADRLFDMGFYPDIQRIFRRTSSREERLTMLFSATLNQSVLNISWKFMNDPVEIEIEPEHITVQTIEQQLYHVAKDEKFNLLLGVLEQENPANALIFCNTRRGCTNISERLRANGYDSEYLIGDLPQKKRLRIIDSFKRAEVRILIATDVAARGLHIENLPLVMNYDLPEDAENYVHRIGRTARVGKSGRAISLACERFVYGLEAIEECIGMKIPTCSVSDDLLRADNSRRHRAERGGRAERRDGRRARSGRSAQGSRRLSPEHAQAPGAPSHGRRDDVRTSGPQKKPVVHEPKGSGPRVPAEASLEERLRHYRAKYGEDFQPADGSTSRKSGEATAAGSGKGRSRRRRGRRKPDAAARSAQTEGTSTESYTDEPTSSASAEHRTEQPRKSVSHSMRCAVSTGAGSDERSERLGLIGRLRRLLQRS